MMVGPLILLAASVAPLSPPVPAGGGVVDGFRPSSAVTARATASVRIVSGVRFGPGKREKIAGGQRRRVQLTDAQGANDDAELLEFQ